MRRWVKLEIGHIDDWSFQRLGAGARLLYYELMCLAGHSDREDGFCGGNVDEAAFGLRRQPGEMAGDLAELVEAGLATVDEAGVRLTRFGEEQDPDSDQERQAARRGKPVTKRDAGVTTPVTKRDAGVTTPVTKRDLDVDVEVEVEQKRTEVDAEVEAEETATSGRLAGFEQVFLEETKLPVFSGGTGRWISSFEKIADAGAQPEDLRTAIRELLAKKYSISGPASCVNAALNVRMRRTAAKPALAVVEDPFTAALLKARAVQNGN